MATISKQFLSNSLSGRQVLVTSLTAVSANAIHTPPAGGSIIDEVWLYAYNSSVSSAVLTILWGPPALLGVQSCDEVKVTVPPQSGRMLVTEGKLIQNSQSIYTYSTISSTINIDGYINRYTY